MSIEEKPEFQRNRLDPPPFSKKIGLIKYMYVEQYAGSEATYSFKCDIYICISLRLFLNQMEIWEQPIRIKFGENEPT